MRVSSMQRTLGQCQKYRKHPLLRMTRCCSAFARIMSNSTLLFLPYSVSMYYSHLANNATCAIPRVHRENTSHNILLDTNDISLPSIISPVSMDLAVISRTAIKRTRIRLSRILLAALNFMRISNIRKRRTQRRPLIAIELKIASGGNDERAGRLSRNDVISGVNSARALLRHLLSLSRPITHNSKQHASLSRFFLAR